MGAVSGCRYPASRARGEREAPGKVVSDKKADRQTER